MSLDGGVGQAGQQQQQQPEAGQVLVTLLPVNEKLPWVTPARWESTNVVVVLHFQTFYLSEELNSSVVVDWISYILYVHSIFCVRT